MLLDDELVVWNLVSNQNTYMSYDWVTNSRLGKHHFTPTSSSWLNLVERWFREITEKRIRRGSFRSVPELIEAIYEYLNNHNQNPRAFVWSAPVERILAKIAKGKEAFDALH